MDKAMARLGARVGLSLALVLWAVTAFLLAISEPAAVGRALGLAACGLVGTVGIAYTPTANRIAAMNGIFEIATAAFFAGSLAALFHARQDVFALASAVAVVGVLGTAWLDQDLDHAD